MSLSKKTYEKFLLLNSTVFFAAIDVFFLLFIITNGTFKTVPVSKRTKSKRSHWNDHIWMCHQISTKSLQEMPPVERNLRWSYAQYSFFNIFGIIVSFIICRWRRELSFVRVFGTCTPFHSRMLPAVILNLQLHIQSDTLCLCSTIVRVYKDSRYNDLFQNLI